MSKSLSFVYKDPKRTSIPIKGMTTTLFLSSWSVAVNESSDGKNPISVSVWAHKWVPRNLTKFQLIIADDLNILESY